MIAAFFPMQIKPGHKDHLIGALKDHARIATATEPGTKRIDIYQDPEDADRIWFYEAYVDQAAFDAHLQGRSHIEKWYDFGRVHCMAEWPPSAGIRQAQSIWTPEDEVG